MRSPGFDIYEQARGKWRGLLGTFGLPDQFLKDRHGPCPLCEDGTDRYRFDNREGRGTWFCNVCGHGDGFDLLMRYKGWDKDTTLREVRSVLGLVQPETPREKPRPEDTRKLLQRIWNEARPIQAGDPADLYLTSRGVGAPRYPGTLRFHPRCWYAKEGEVNVFHPALVGVIQSPEGKGINLQRIYLTPDGRKIEGEEKKFLATSIPGGSAVRLGKVGPVLGVAEGIVTALAATRLFGVPVWAALNAGNLGVFEPPAEVEELWVFGDNDPCPWAGQKAAYILANRFALKKGKTVALHIPSAVGYDWADVLQKEGLPCPPSSPSSASLSGSLPSSSTPETSTALH